MRVRLPSASPAAAAAAGAPQPQPGSEPDTTPRTKRPRVTPPPPTAIPPPPTTAAAARLLQADGSDSLAELMLAVPAPRIELPAGADAACADVAAAARLCRALLDKARELKHKGDSALRASSSSAADGAGASTPGAVAVWDGRALSLYMCAAVTYIECTELVHRLGRVLAERQQRQEAAAASSSGPGELARLAAQLRPQLMAQTATLCHAAAAGARQRLARLGSGGGGGEGGAAGDQPNPDDADAEQQRQQQRAQYVLYAALGERLAAVCHLRHVAAQALVLRADVKLCAAAGGGATGGGGSTPPPSSGGGGGPTAAATTATTTSATTTSGPTGPQNRLADAAQHTLRAIDLVAGSSRALRLAAADPRTRACVFASAAVAHSAHVSLDLGAPGGGGDVFRLAARARAALACIKSMVGSGGGRR